MNRITLSSLLCAMLLLLTACGSSTAPNDDPPGPGPQECRVTVTNDLTFPMTLENGPEACDYWFPGGAAATTYYVSSEITIEPGTVLRFGRDVRLYVHNSGSLQASGSPEARIVFEGELSVPGFWYGICFGDSRKSRLENVDVRWGGKVWIGGMECRGGISGSIGNSEPVDIIRTTVAGSYTVGLNVRNLVLGEFSSNAFGGNSDFGVSIDPAQVHKLDTGSDYLGASLGAVNGKPYVHASGAIRDPGQYHEWRKLNAPYLAADYALGYGENILITDNTGLVLHPGVTIYFGTDSSLALFDASRLRVAGTREEPVILTGVHGTRGSWRGVSISDSMAEIHNLEVRWAGGDAPFSPGSLSFRGAAGTARNILVGVRIEGSGHCAFRIDDEALELLEGLDNITYSNNERDYCGPS